MTVRLKPFAVALVALLASGPTASAQLTFNITSDPLNPASAQMLAGVQQAAALWSALFNDPVTINVKVGAKVLPAIQIGQTNAFFDPYSYADVRTALVADAKSADDLSATTFLQSGSAFSMLINRTANNPNGVVSATPYFDTGLGGPGQAGAENNGTIRMTSANAKALGLYPSNAPGSDGTINFNTLKAYDFDRTNGITAGQVDFVGVAAHELGHLLGFISGVETLDGNGTAPGLNDNQLRFVAPIDLFRFSARSVGAGGGVGVIDWTADNTGKYFSVNGGTTAAAAFANGSDFGDGAEASHWKDAQGNGLMDPSAAGGELLLISANDRRAFDAMGYDLAPVPEPSACLALGLAGWAAVALRGRPRSRRPAG